MTRRALRWLASAWRAAVDYALALAGILLLGAAANILLVALVVALPGGVLLLPYLLRRWKASLGLGSLSSLLLRNGVAEPAPRRSCADTTKQDTGRERVEPRGCGVTGPGAATAPGDARPGFPRRVM